MKIVFLTQNDPIYVVKFFERFLLTYSDLSEIIGVVVSRPMGKKSTLDLAKQMLHLYGPFGFFRMAIKYAYAKASDCIWLSCRIGRTSSIPTLCRKLTIPLIYEDNINSDSFISRLEDLQPDLLISVASPFVFSKDLIQASRKACINIHNAPLPKYRGMLPSFWQLYNQEKFGGITIHEVNEKLDEGRIISQKSVQIKENETLHSLIIKTKVASAHMLNDVINMYDNDTVTYYENRPEEGTYFSFPTRHEARTFRKMGMKFF